MNVRFAPRAALGIPGYFLNGDETLDLPYLRIAGFFATDTPEKQARDLHASSPQHHTAALVDALWVGLAVEPGDQQAELREDLRAFCTSRVPWRIPPGPLRSSASQRWVSQEAFMEEFVDGYEQTLGREPSEIAAGSGALTF